MIGRTCWHGRQQWTQVGNGSTKITQFLPRSQSSNVRPLDANQLPHFYTNGKYLGHVLNQLSEITYCQQYNKKSLFPIRLKFTKEVSFSSPAIANSRARFLYFWFFIFLIHLSISWRLALRNILLTFRYLGRSFSFHLKATVHQLRCLDKIIAILTSVITRSPTTTLNLRPSKNSFRLFLNRTSQLKMGLTTGISILPNQSKAVSLLQPSVAQVPLLLQPRGCFH